MVGGRRGGYREYEARERDVDFGKASRRFESRVENGRDLDHERSQARFIERQKEDYDGRNRVRSRHVDVRGRDGVNVGRSLGVRIAETSGNGHTRINRELSEVSVRSDDISYSPASGNNRNSNKNDSRNVENGHIPVEEKKRKFSPIVWDIDEKQADAKLKTRRTLQDDSHAQRAVSSPPDRHCTHNHSTEVNLIESNVLSSELSSHVTLETVQIDIAVTAAQADSPASRSSVMDVGLVPQAPDHDIEEEDYVPTRNISASRWADEGFSPRDEGEIIDDVVINDIGGKSIASSKTEEAVYANRMSPEPGEFTRDGSQEAVSRSSGSGKRSASGRSASEDDSPGGALNRNGYMDVDEDDNERNQSTESEDEESGHLAAPCQRSINMLLACRSVDDFQKLNKIDEGTYGVVFRARDTKSGEVVALKKVKMEKEREGFPLTSLREINILLSLHHPSIVDVKEVVVGSKLDDVFMVMEYMEHDLKALMETMRQPFSQSEVKCLMLQLLEGVNYLHGNWALHRDLKTSNLLLNNRGELKICDFGLARQYGSPLKPYTQLVVTLWYRAPELLLGAKEYSTAIDMWSLGCIMAEMLAKEPLFNGKSEVDQLGKIYRMLGTPNEKIWPGVTKLPGVKGTLPKNPYNKLREKFPPTSFSGGPTLSEAGFNLLNQLLTYDPEKRITAEAALNHRWFQEVPLPKSKEFMPTFPAQHSQDRRVQRVMKSPDPLQELREKERRGDLIGTGSLFG